MALKDLFTMVKSDRYTQDGRDQLIKALEVETEDRTYNIGEISEKTGLQKTANGWRPPKKSVAKALKEADRNAYNKAVKNISTERLQEAFNKREGKELTPEAKAKHEIIKAELESRKSGSEALNKTWSKKDVIKELPEGWKRVEGATTAPNGYVVVSNNQSRFGGNRETKLIKQEDYLNAVKQSESKNWNDFFSDMDKKVYGENKPELSGSRESEQSKPAITKAPKPSVQEYMKAQDTVKKYDETYKKQLEEYENGQRLRANGGGAILDPMYGLKPNDLSKNEEYQKAKDIIQRMEAEDAAPHVLTGDTRIRIRK